MKKFEIKKSTLGDHNNGHTSLSFTNLGNSRYTGHTVCWQIICNIEDVSLDVGPVCAVSRKSDAVKFAEYLNEIKYDGVGDPVMMFRSHLYGIEDWETIEKLKEV